jgi:hypothetical protein
MRRRPVTEGVSGTPHVPGQTSAPEANPVPALAAIVCIPLPSPQRRVNVQDAPPSRFRLFVGQKTGWMDFCPTGAPEWGAGDARLHPISIIS